MGLQSGYFAFYPPPAYQESAMGEPEPATAPSVKPSEDLLDSWKEIAVYLDRDVTTVQRWEKREGMPVHRHLHHKLGSVYALGSELDAWLQSRNLRLQKELKEPAPGQPQDGEAEQATPTFADVNRWFIVGIGVAVLALLTVGYVIARIRTGDVQPLKIKSLAVLPLKNLSGDPAQDYLADGMTEALIGRLSSIHDLRVISRTSAMRFKDTQLRLPEIARRLHVDAVLEGSVVREGSRIRVYAQLIRVATDDHLWSETYDREFQDVLALQSDVAQAVAERVEVTVSGEEHLRLVNSRHVAPEVYESYLKGEFIAGNTREDIEKSIAYFEDAIKKDPTFAPAYVGLAEAYDTLATVQVGMPPEQVRPKELDAVHRALELDPELAEAHAVLASVYQAQWRWNEAEAEYKRALELNPNDPSANLGFADWLMCQGRMDEALAVSQRAREVDPLGVTGLGNGWILFHARRYEEAIREFRSLLAVHPDNASAYWFLGFALSANGQPGEAIPELEKALSLSGGSPGVTGVLIRAYAQAGRRTDALRLLNELKARQRKGYIPAAAFVNAYLGLGDRQKAFVWLERAYQEHSNILQFAKVHPYFDPLRGDPRFQELIERIGFPPQSDPAR
jgi:TolB-like protein/Tfp pilus assembly protein PilF